jgi:RNA recognition motif-containing protein
MNTKIHVGNLSFNVSNEDLEKAFSAYGKLNEVSIIKDKFSGRSKGFGFITFENEEDMKKAISEMNGKPLDGRELKVSEAKPQEPRDRDFNDRRPPRSFGNRSNDRGFGNNRRRF